jgi:hypothetical protein
VSRRVRRGRTACLVLALLAAGCAARQRIPIDCVPEGATVYLDGKALEGVPEAIELDPEQPHTLYVKGDEIVPELVVLESREVDGKLRLSPAEVCVRPRAFRPRRELHVEIDPHALAGNGDAEDEAQTVDVEPRPDFVPYRP